jgi:hypothetical protein
MGVTPETCVAQIFKALFFKDSSSEAVTVHQRDGREGWDSRIADFYDGHEV